ncbi:hypothetical protein NDGK_02709 [Clostridiales bacterium CHKCI001]|nr:hypothetical protein NDGK_02709 [Clostridiales bacterium CHKCI001]
MKKNIFVVPILSLVAGVISNLVFRVIVRIMDMIMYITTPEGQIIESGGGYNYIIFAVSVVLIILMGILLRKWDFDKITIFKSVTVLAVYIVVILVAFSIYYEATETSTPGAVLLEMRLSYPFSVYESIRSIILGINRNMMDFWIDRIAIVLFPYVLVLFGKSRKES